MSDNDMQGGYLVPKVYARALKWVTEKPSRGYHIQPRSLRDRLIRALRLSRWFTPRMVLLLINEDLTIEERIEIDQ
jgi:hypothetical protein